ncbi:MAG: hypothetical protein MAG795_00070 [Candidatus Woesearchaeota archaeon]|nr:hypothetical protein [Candidatus Woesearchaeota archaeon]
MIKLLKKKKKEEKKEEDKKMPLLLIYRETLKKLLSLKQRVKKEPNKGHSEEFFKIFRLFAQKFFQIRYEFTYQELVKETNKIKLGDDAKLMLKSLATDMSKSAFSNQDFSNDQLLQQINQFEDLLIQVSIELNDPGSKRSKKTKTHKFGFKNLAKKAKGLMKKAKKKKRPPKDHLREMYVLFRKGYGALEKREANNARKVLTQINQMYEKLASFEREQFDDEIIEFQKEIEELEGDFEKQSDQDLSKIYKKFASAYEALENSQMHKAWEIVKQINILCQKLPAPQAEEFIPEIKELKQEIRKINAKDVKIEEKPKPVVKPKTQDKKAKKPEKQVEQVKAVKSEQKKDHYKPKMFGDSNKKTDTPVDLKEPKKDLNKQDSENNLIKDELKAELKKELKKELEDEFKTKENGLVKLNKKQDDKEQGIKAQDKTEKQVEDLHLEAVKKKEAHFKTNKKESEDSEQEIIDETKDSANELKEPKTKEDLEAMIHAAKHLLESGEYNNAKEYYQEAMKFKTKLGLKSRTKRKIDYELMGIGVDLKLAGLA